METFKQDLIYALCAVAMFVLVVGGAHIVLWAAELPYKKKR